MGFPDRRRPRAHKVKSLIELLDHIDAYCDALPRVDARVEEHGPLVLFAREGQGWPYYARPRRGGPAIGVSDVQAVRDRERELGLPETFEWITDLRPDMRAAGLDAGLVVLDHPLMVLTEELRTPPPPEGVDVRLIDPTEDRRLIGAVPTVAFAHPGTDRGEVGHEALEAAAAKRSAARNEADQKRALSGRLVSAAAFVDGRPVSFGLHQPRDGVTEIAGIGTLPAFRRRGIGAAITAVLVADARQRGIETIFLTAGDEVVARVYASLGFARAGTAGAAEPA